MFVLFFLIAMYISESLKNYDHIYTAMSSMYIIYR